MKSILFSTLFIAACIIGDKAVPKNEEDVKNVCYFEVNDVNPLNALEFVLEDGRLFFNHVVLFASNINIDPETGRVKVYNNENVQFLLDHNEEYLQPLRKCGIKVIMSILGNHDASGVSQLSDLGAKEFARELANYCYTYNLDGVGFDDEYSKVPDLSNPWLAECSYKAASRLLYETKKAMPDKIVTVFAYGHMDENCPVTDGMNPNQFVDYVVPNYARSAKPMLGMTKKQCGAFSIELTRGYGLSEVSEAKAKQWKDEGYGYVMYFSLDPLTNYKTSIECFKKISKGLYNTELIEPTVYYKKNDLTPIQIK